MSFLRWPARMLESMQGLNIELFLYIIQLYLLAYLVKLGSAYVVAVAVTGENGNAHVETNVLTKVVLDNRLALDCLLAEQGSVCVVANTPTACR